MALVGLPAKTLVERLEVAEKEVIELRIKNKILIDRLAEITTDKQQDDQSENEQYNKKRKNK